MGEFLRSKLIWTRSGMDTVQYRGILFSLGEKEKTIELPLFSETQVAICEKLRESGYNDINTSQSHLSKLESGRIDELTIQSRNTIMLGYGVEPRRLLLWEKENLRTRDWPRQFRGKSEKEINDNLASECSQREGEKIVALPLYYISSSVDFHLANLLNPDFAKRDGVEFEKASQVKGATIVIEVDNYFGNELGLPPYRSGDLVFLRTNANPDSIPDGQRVLALIGGRLSFRTLRRGNEGTLLLPISPVLCDAPISLTEHPVKLIGDVIFHKGKPELIPMPTDNSD